MIKEERVLILTCDSCGEEVIFTINAPVNASAQLLFEEFEYQQDYMTHWFIEGEKTYCGVCPNGKI